jgi:hypothetical protein
MPHRCLQVHNKCKMKLRIDICLKISVASDQANNLYFSPHIIMRVKANQIWERRRMYEYIVRLAVATIKSFIINQYFTIEYLFPATCNNVNVFLG